MSNDLAGAYPDVGQDPVGADQDPDTGAGQDPDVGQDPDTGADQDPDPVGVGLDPHPPTACLGPHLVADEIDPDPDPDPDRGTVQDHFTAGPALVDGCRNRAGDDPITRDSDGLVFGGRCPVPSGHAQIQAGVRV